MRDVFPKSRSLQVKRCSHLTSSFLAWSHSSLGHSSRPWRFRSSRIQFFQVPWEVFHKASVRRVTGSTWLAGVTLPATTLMAIMMGWALRFLKQIGTWEDPGCNSLYVVVGTTEVGIWGHHACSVSMWTCMQCPGMSVLLCILTVANGGMVTSM